jgi:predicted transcriptional regulator
MSYTDTNFSPADNELANFAKALALPVRIAIIRTIINNGNFITKENFYNIPYAHETIAKHIAELRTLGIIKASGYKGNMKYGLDEGLFYHMSNKLTSLLSCFAMHDIN